ncbi:MAG: phosphatidate cytidylyltransferase [Chlorobi bacterium]|nr:phosphatidate cytidylyltransferase [Chlorobiota bacterium]
MADTTSPGWPRGITQFEQRHGNATMRVVSGILGIPIVLGAIWLGGWAFFLLMAIISTGALLEFYWITEKRGALPNKKLGVIFGLLLALAFMHGVTDRLLLDIFHVRPDDLAVMLARFTLAFGVLLIFAIAVMIDQMFRKEGSPIINTMATLAGVTYISLFLSTLIGLRQLFTSELPFRHYIERFDATLLSRTDRLGALTVLAIMVAIWTCDSFAYYAGRGFGRHKLFERVSPKKTWEGSVAGAIGGAAAMIGMQQWFLPYLTVWDAVVIGLIAGVFGQLGDLAESHMKRDAGVKDSSQIIPGHGGIFDRFDSLLFVAPLVYIYLNFIVLTR